MPRTRNPATIGRQRRVAECPDSDDSLEVNSEDEILVKQTGPYVTLDDHDSGVIMHDRSRFLRAIEVTIPVQSRTRKGDSSNPLRKQSNPSRSVSSPSSSGQSPSISPPYYETPGTTPGTSDRPPTFKHPRISSRTDTIEMQDDPTIHDEAIAAALHEEEISGDIERRSHTIIDSESDLSEAESQLSFILEDEEMEEEDELTRSKMTMPSSSRSGPSNYKAGKSSSKRKINEIDSRDRSATKKTVAARHAGTAAQKRRKIEVAKTEPLEADDDEESDFTDSSESDNSNEHISDSEEDVPPLSSGGPRDATQARSRAPTYRTLGRARAQARRARRFGNIDRTRAREMAEDIEEMVNDLRFSRKERERRKLERAHPTIKTMWDDLAEIPVIKPVPAEQPASINRRLKPFQLEGLDWMVKQEKTRYAGGLLGDEMGMGKTIQAVSLIMSDYPQKQPTLVLVPPVALMQWSSEITDYTDGKLNVLVYHGQNSKVKGMSVNDLKKFDVIMISYNSLESLYRKETKGWTRGSKAVKEKSPIHAIDFHRLILDEAHSIKSRTTGIAKACFALRGRYKWCLSGTPVQNRIGEFFSLLRFLEVRPFADYFCKRCPCSMIHWQLDESHMCKSCKHSGIEHISVFNRELLNPLTQSEDPSERESAMDKLHMITARIMLRRMKRDYVSSMELPPKEVVIHKEFFGDIERDFSSSIMSNTNRQFDTYVARGVMLNNYANIFGLIMQMRQVSNHPDLLLKKHGEEGQNVLVCNICDEVAEDAVRSQCKHDFCRSCVKSYVQSVGENGGDADCPRCHIALSIDFDQPEIEQDADSVKKSSIINRIKMQDWTSSTKIEMLIYDLWKLRSKKQTLKSIVFSQFTSMLQLIEWRLRRAGFSTVMLDGSMTPTQRQRSIEYFMNNPEVEIFLVSLKAGGVALNLTEASRVFIVDPWWNPAAEWQSADRCHRIGQRRPCVITRLCIEDSVESRIVMLQEKKANMINGTINNDRTSMEKLTPEDMQFLFRGT